MVVLSIIEKLLIFKSKNRKTSIEISKELDISTTYLSLVLQGHRKISDKLNTKIEQLFKSYGFDQYNRN